MNEYLLPPEEREWAGLLENWNWLLPDTFGVWLANSFGDLFLELESGEIALLDINAGKLEILADSQETFIDRISDPANAAAWLYMPLVDALRAQGIVPPHGSCYAFSRPPLLGGEYRPENVRLTELEAHLAFTGDLAEQLRDVKDGDEVELKVRGGDFRGCEKPDCCSKGPNPTPGSCSVPGNKSAR